jgi:hypothetical protein
MAGRRFARLLKLDHAIYEWGCLLFTADSRLLIMREDKQVSFWSVEEGQRLQTIKADNGASSTASSRFAVSRDGKLLALIEDGDVSIWVFPWLHKSNRVGEKDTDTAL